jgi:hypothetical protein
MPKTEYQQFTRSILGNYFAVHEDSVSKVLSMSLKSLIIGAAINNVRNKLLSKTYLAAYWVFLKLLLD